MVTHVRVLLLGVACCTLLAGCGERERLWYGTRSDRVEGAWNMALLGRNPHGVEDCNTPLETLEIRMDRWFTSEDFRDRMARNELGDPPSGARTDYRPSKGPWKDWTFDVLATGEVSVDGSSARAYLAEDVRSSDGSDIGGVAWLLLEVQPTEGPLAECGWGNRLSLFLYAAPGNASGDDSWETDHLLVSFGEEPGGTERPHEYARARRD